MLIQITFIGKADHLSSSDCLSAATGKENVGLPEFDLFKVNSNMYGCIHREGKKYKIKPHKKKEGYFVIPSSHVVAGLSVFKPLVCDWLAFSKRAFELEISRSEFIVE